MFAFGPAALWRHLFDTLIQLLIVLVGISVLVFLIVHLIPGDPAVLVAGLEASPEVLDRIRRDLGLDQPLTVQFWHFLGRTLHGDLGTSIRTGSPVAQEIVERFPHTVRLAVGGILVAAAVGLVAGVAAAVRHNRLWDHVIMVADAHRRIHAVRTGWR